MNRQGRRLDLYYGGRRETLDFWLTGVLSVGLQVGLVGINWAFFCGFRHGCGIVNSVRITRT